MMVTRIVVLAGLLLSGGLSQAREPRVLRDGDVVSSSGNVGDIHHYTIELQTGDFLEISASQETGGVYLDVVGPDEVLLRQINMPELRLLDERMMLVAAQTGPHRVDVRLDERLDGQGTTQQYTLRVLAVRAATARDEARAGCFVTMQEGDQARRVQSMDSFAKAVDAFGSAAACYRALDDSLLEAIALTSKAELAALFSRYADVGIPAFERLVELHRAAGHTEGQQASLKSLMVEYEDAGRFDRARDTARAVLDLATQRGDRRTVAYAMGRASLHELYLGNYASARAAATDALDIATREQDVRVQAFALTNLARLDELAGDDSAARTRYERALRLSGNDQVVLAMTPIDLGFLYLRQGEYALAEDSFKQRLQHGGRLVQREQEARARVGLGDVQRARGDRDGARVLYDTATATLVKSTTSYRCIGEERLGRLDLDDGRLDDAERHFAAMRDVVSDSAVAQCEAPARAGLAEVALRRGAFDVAETEARTVVDLTERFREAVPSLESRALGFGALAPAFERLVDITMRRAARGDDGAGARAFAFNERSLARALLDQIAQATLDERATLPEALGRERQRVREQRQARLAELQLATRSATLKPRAAALLEEITTLDVAIRDLDARADAADGRRPGLLTPRPLDLASIQALLDEDTQLVEYALGEHQSYAWVVSPTGVQWFTLAPRADIAAAARAVQQDLLSPATADGPKGRAHRRTLARHVLEPLASALTARRLVIVATGALALVPFSALPAPAQTPVQPLVARYEIVHAPSATTLAAMRTLGTRRTAPQKAAVVFADPIFEASDPRLPAVRARGTRPPGATSAAALPRLPFSRREALAIRAAVHGDVAMFTDAAATRTRVLGNALADYRVVHFATHGLVHPEIASLSSIVLSGVDSHGKKQDPFVTLADIYEMRLNADVVVLSACSTAAGKNIPGEGPIGLARAFMYAGAPRVVASLWQVNDIATAELMRRFYRGMFIDRLTPAAALRRAQQQLAAIPRWASPYFWAPFVLQGDWR